MNILGISCYYHDAAAALLMGGELVAAAEEERFTRKKHDSSFPRQAIEFCLKHAGLKAEELDYVVFYEKPLVKFERILQTTLSTFPKSWGVFRESMVTWFDEKLWIKSKLQTGIGVPANKILFVEHHLTHAASAMFCSPYADAAVVTIDGVGIAAVDSTVLVGGAQVATGRRISLPAPAPSTLFTGPVVLRGANGRTGATYRYLVVRE